MSMNINNVSAVNAYLHVSSSTAVRKSAEPVKQGKKDTVEFSAKAMAMLNSSATETTDSARKAAAAMARENASDARIAELKASVQAGTYNIPAKDIAASILNA